MLEIRSQRSETEIMAAHVKVQVMNEFAKKLVEYHHSSLSRK